MMRQFMIFGPKMSKMGFSLNLSLYGVKRARYLIHLYVICLRYLNKVVPFGSTESRNRAWSNESPGPIQVYASFDRRAEEEVEVYLVRRVLHESNITDCM